MSAKIELRSVRDVRKLGTCAVCKGDQLGMVGVDLIRIVTRRNAIGRTLDSYDVHPLCLSIETLLALPDENLDQCTMLIGVERMKLISGERDRRRKARKRAAAGGEEDPHGDR